MDQLFERPPSKKLLLLTKEGLTEYIQYYSNCISQLRRQMMDLQRENERLRAELGYGQTITMQFPDDGGSPRRRAGKKSAS